MGAEDVEAIITLLKFYSVGMLGLGLNEILSKAFFLAAGQQNAYEKLGYKYGYKYFACVCTV